MQKSRRKK